MNDWHKSWEVWDFLGWVIFHMCLIMLMANWRDSCSWTFCNPKLTVLGVACNWISWSNPILLGDLIHTQVVTPSPNLNWSFWGFSEPFLWWFVICCFGWVVRLILKCFGTFGTCSNHVFMPNTYLQSSNPQNSSFLASFYNFVEGLWYEGFGLIFKWYETLGSHLGTWFYRFPTST